MADYTTTTGITYSNVERANVGNTDRSEARYMRRGIFGGGSNSPRIPALSTFFRGSELGASLVNVGADLHILNFGSGYYIKASRYYFTDEYMEYDPYDDPLIGESEDVEIDGVRVGRRPLVECVDLGFYSHLIRDAQAALPSDSTILYLKHGGQWTDNAENREGIATATAKVDFALADGVLHVQPDIVRQYQVLRYMAERVKLGGHVVFDLTPGRVRTCTTTYAELVGMITALLPQLRRINNSTFGWTGSARVPGILCYEKVEDGDG